MADLAIWRLAIAELAIFIVLLPIVLYILVRHGRHGIEGWGFLAIFCVLRLTSSGIEIGDRDGTSSTGSIINSIGISGLLLAYSGILQEVARTDVSAAYRQLGLIFALIVHIQVAAGIALAAIGGSKLAKPQDQNNNYANDHTLQKAGYAILLLATVLMLAYNVILILRHHSRRTSRKNHAAKLLYFVLAALVFGIIRVVYGLAAAVSTSPRLNPVTGTFAVKFLLIFLVQLTAALLLIVGGLMTTGLQHETRRVNEGSARGGR